MQTHRALPNRKTLGTAYNLRPVTRRVPARALRGGDVVLESDEYPVVIMRIGGMTKVTIHAKYIWQEPWEATWMLGVFDADHPFDRAIAGEYPKPTR